MQIGLIGIGLLGAALAERFLEARFSVTGFDTDPQRISKLTAFGGTAAATAAEAAAQPYVVLSLPDSTISARVAAEIPPEATIIDTTTGAPDEMAAIGARHARYIDATIAGSSEQVRQGDAVVMAGGRDEDVERCRPIFESFARRTFHAGPCGAGARLKLVVNLVLGLNRAALAEGLFFAQSTGVDPALALEALRAGPAYSVAMDRKGAKMLARDWTPEARLRQHHKDVRLIIAEGYKSGIRLALSEVHEDLLSIAEAEGFADADNSAVFEAVQRIR